MVAPVLLTPVVFCATLQFDRRAEAPLTTTMPDWLFDDTQVSRSMNEAPEHRKPASLGWPKATLFEITARAPVLTAKPACPLLDDVVRSMEALTPELPDEGKIRIPCLPLFSRKQSVTFRILFATLRASLMPSPGFPVKPKILQFSMETVVATATARILMTTSPPPPAPLMPPEPLIERLRMITFLRSLAVAPVSLMTIALTDEARMDPK